MPPTVYNDDEVAREHRRLMGDRSRALADFLLERIADDEREATTRRRFAECDARRRIVELHDADTHMCRDESYLADGTPYRTDDWADGPCVTLRILAAPYIDHPDYRAEWQPPQPA